MDTKNTDFQSMMSSFMQNAQKMQETLKGAYDKIAEKNKHRTVEGLAGGDMVKVVANLKLEIQSIDVKPEMLEEKPEVYLELIAAATNQAISKAQAAMKQEMMEAAQKMGMPSDFKMPNMPGETK